MSKSTRSSAQRSRHASPSEEDVIETQEELPSSEHEEDPEVSFNPHQLPQPSQNQTGQPQLVAGMYMPYIEGPHVDWKSMIIFTIDFLSGTLNVKIF